MCGQSSQDRDCCNSNSKRHCCSTVHSILQNALQFTLLRERQNVIQSKAKHSYRLISVSYRVRGKKAGSGCKKRSLTAWPRQSPIRCVGANLELLSSVPQAPAPGHRREAAPAKILSEPKYREPEFPHVTEIPPGLVLSDVSDISADCMSLFGLVTGKVYPPPNQKATIFSCRISVRCAEEAW